MTQSTVKKNIQIVPEQNKPLSAAALDARRKYYRDYNKKNRDKRKAWNHSHWERVAAQQTEERQEA